MFMDKCRVKKGSINMLERRNLDEKYDAQSFCYKQVASNNLMAKKKCSAKASKYVDFVFDKCVADKSPFAVGRSTNIRNFVV
mmetsp:Transcript_17934/g.30509  ORF Transcript_17934/g.30509 Transcript_17934/m.30509 type:complete len:82 (+) Transcript_17934:579-824(+)